MVKTRLSILHLALYAATLISSTVFYQYATWMSDFNSISIHENIL